MDFLQVHQLVKRIKGAPVVSAVSFSMYMGERLAIAGETGSGKSSLLRMIAALEQADEGAVFFKGEKIKGPHEKLLPGHPGIAYLSQHFELPHFLKVDQVLEYASVLTEKERQEVGELCDVNHLLRRRTDQLSGGETQRVALARLIVGRPSLLLLDEPYSNVDVLHKNLLKKVVHDLELHLGLTCILVSHDPADILSWAGKIMVMKDGVVRQTGSPEEIYRQPTDDYVAGLFGRFTRPDEALNRQLDLPFSSINYLRPDELEWSTDPGGLPVIVKQVSFCGAYTEIEAEWGRNRIWLFGKRGIQAGDTIFITGIKKGQDRNPAPF